MRTNPEPIKLQLTPTNIFFSKDNWEACELGLRVNTHRKEKSLSFQNIHQIWLKQLVKRYIMYAATNKSFHTLQSYIACLNRFSRFLLDFYPSINLSKINRSLILEYLNYLNNKGLSPSSKRNSLCTLKTFFDTGSANQWFEISPCLIRPEDYPKQTKSVPRYIPEEVLKQLNQHLDALPEPVMRMVLIIQECGLRVGELCQLPINCLKQDTREGWYIQFMRWKMGKETTLPISSELAAVIIEQQNYIRENLDRSFDYLFCAKYPPRFNINPNKKDFLPKPTVMYHKSFVRFLKDLSEDFDIKDNSGKRWNFQSHQFRHTVATRMINNGVPQHIIQRYLGHDSPEMTARYAHIQPGNS